MSTQQQLDLLRLNYLHFGIFVVVWTMPTLIQYVYICVEMVGSITSTMVKATIALNGQSVEILATFKNGGELTNPKHVKLLYCSYDSLTGQRKEGISNQHP